ncbi:pyridoxamine 5'-phosphate oxidase family protein [Kitasatospora misakiensis]|uniref:Pyridoxamine 5'-phosphate oxidase family protein n=1 Tax=Kitasatospora misakiensis TaxID=67330 RepID=A0ABW0WYB6_9ACTN
MALTRDERERFLAEPRVAALSVDAGKGLGPLVVPVWYRYEPGGDVRVMTDAGCRKALLIEKAGRFSLMVECTEPQARYVSVEGPVVRTSPGSIELFREVAAHYLAPELVESCVEIAAARYGGERVVFHMRPERWLSRDLSMP